MSKSINIKKLWSEQKERVKNDYKGIFSIFKGGGSTPFARVILYK